MSAAAANPVTVSPLPGTEDASGTTQISFLGRRGTRVYDVRVVGSRSGVHAGVLRAYSTGTGESFLPAIPFLAGEHVVVHARVIDGRARGEARTSFTVAEEATLSEQQFPLNAGEASAVQHYVSAPELTPTTVTLTTPAQPGATPGDLFMAPYQGAGSPGPMISEQNGNLVWFHPLAPGEEATNFRVQQYEGKPVLTWWQGHILEVGFGQGEDEIYNSAYEPVATVQAGNGYSTDLHELRLTPEGTAWVDAFDPIHIDLSAYHGPSDGLLTDSVVQEIDVKTGLVMWEWHALGHIPISETQNPLPEGGYPWDYVHINSIDPGPSGDLLLSARNTWTVYDVALHSGAVVWRLGGADSSFKQQAGTHFYWQHDAEFQPGGLISLFDNGSDPPEESQSRALILKPDLKTHTVTLMRQFVNPTKTLLAESQGDALSLSRGNWLVGLWRAAQLHRVRRLRRRRARRRARQGRAGLQDVPRALERAAEDAAVVRRRTRRALLDDGVDELERRDRRRLLARARRTHAEHARTGAEHAEERLSDERQRACRRPGLRGAGARTRAAP